MKYQCSICGYEYDEKTEGTDWENLPNDWCCPICEAPKIGFGPMEDKQEKETVSKDKKLIEDVNYVCDVCGYQYNEKAEGMPFSRQQESYRCPICSAGYIYFKNKGKVKEEVPVLKETELSDDRDLSYLSGFERSNDEVEMHMDMIHTIAKTGKSVSEPMRTKLHVASWNDILFMGAQLSKMPLEERDEVNTVTIIGKNAEQPMIIKHPVLISHMSFGALSKEMKLALSKGSAMAKTAMSSGEGGILAESMEAAYKYIFEYVPNLYSATDENLKKADAIEIKIGQGTKPGMGGHLPGKKVTEEISKVRNKPLGKDIISPSKFAGIESKEDLKTLVDSLREKSKGRPIGIKIAAGRIEGDLEFIAYAKPDFVTIDGRGGATGSSPKVIKDSTTMPTIFALHRARKYLDENDLDIDLIITGGLRISSDFAKALAMGADAIAIGTAAMMATVCQQYRVCNNGKCPVGCATQDEELRKRLNVDNSAMRLYNYLKVTLDEIKTFARITGCDDVHKLSAEDLCTVNSEISNHTNIKHV